MNLAFYAPLGTSQHGGPIVGLALRLTSIGHTVTVYHDGPTGVTDGVSFAPRSTAQNNHDVLIYVDVPEAMMLRLCPRQWLLLTALRPFDPNLCEWVYVPHAAVLRTLAARHPIVAQKVVALTLDSDLSAWTEQLILPPPAAPPPGTLADVPETPALLVPKPEQMCQPLVLEAIRQWRDQAKPARILADPVLGLEFPTW